MGLPAAGVVVLGVAVAAYTIYTNIQMEEEQRHAEYIPSAPEIVSDDEEEEEEIVSTPQPPLTHRRQTGPRFCTHPPVTRCESPPRLVRAPPRRRRRDRARDVFASADGRLRRSMHRVKRRLLTVNRRKATNTNVNAHVVDDDNGRDEEEVPFCVVDLEPIRPGERAVVLPCLHRFHADCILPYLNNLDEPCCPIDRCPIPREDVARLPVWTVTS